jgi:hypothetical protein
VSTDVTEEHISSIFRLEEIISATLATSFDRLCGLVSEFLSTDREVPGSIPGASRFSEKQWVWIGVHSASRGQLRSYLKEKVAAPVKKTEINDRGNPLR